VINNQVGATWDHQNDSQFDYDGGATPVFNNKGTFKKSAGTGVIGGGFGGAINVNNSGTVIAQAGILLVGDSYTQTRGSTQLNGGNISTSGTTTMTVNGGSVLGIGTITGGVTNNSGTVSPTITTATGTLSISGGASGFYAQGSAGTLLLDIRGSTSGKFDLLSATGQASLAGSAQLCLINGFKPSIGTPFTVLTYGSETGTFSTVNFGWSFSYGTTSAVATYQGAPVDSFSNNSLSFPSQLINTTSAPLVETLTNNGQATLTISSVTLTGTNAADYKITSNTCGTTLPVGAQCKVTVTFKPAALGTRTAAISFSDNACASPHSIALSGKGTEITFAPSPVAFGNQPVGTTSSPMTVTVTNHGTTTVTVTNASITGTNSSDFAISSNSCTTLVGGGTCTIEMTFTPSATGSRAATLSLTDNDKGSSQTNKLTGTGT
jgi:hypothetical protein